MKLTQKKNGKGYITSYQMNIGCAEARQCGFIDENGKPVELEKIILPDKKTIIIQIKSDNE